MQLVEIYEKLKDRKEFKTNETRRRNIILRKIEELDEKMHEEEPGLLITHEQVLSGYIDHCINHGSYVLDIETTGLDCFDDIIVGICLYAPGQLPAYIPIYHTDIDNDVLPGQIDETIVMDEIQRLLISSSKWINANIKFDAKFLVKHWGLKIPDENIFWDTRVGAFLLNENEPTHALKPLYDKYVLKQKTTGSKFKDLFDNVTFNYIPLKYAKVYGANDGYKTWKLYEFQLEYLDLDHKRPDMQKLAQVFFNIEMPLIPLLVNMELTGVMLDLDRAEELNQKYTEKSDAAMQVLVDFVGKYEDKLKKNKTIAPLIEKTGFNFNSPTQLQAFLYDILKLPTVNKRSTDKATLDSLMEVAKGEQREFLEALFSYKQVTKLLTSFIQKLPAEVKDDGAIHGQFNSCGTATGRFSSSSPNMQQVSGGVRPMFSARPGYILIGSDLSQIEVRVTASLSGDPTMINAYNTGEDLYSKMASEIHNKPYEECMEFHPVTRELQKEGKKLRSDTKSILLGTLYGRQAKSIGQQIGSTEKEAQKLIDSFFKSFPKVQEMDRMAKLGAGQHGYVTTITGRKRRLPGVKSRDRWEKARAERQCLNAIIQGTSADMLKLAMVRIHQNPRMREIGARLLLTVHDRA